MDKPFSDDITEFITTLNHLSTENNLSSTLLLSKYSSSPSIVLFDIPEFKTDLLCHLQQLLTFYNENNYPEEKYIMLLIHLLFGTNLSPTSSSIAKKRSHPSQPSTSLYTMFPESHTFTIYYKDQNTNLLELSMIILHTILKIEQFITEIDTNNSNNINTSLSSDSDEIENYFESEITDYFLKHFCLYKESLHKLIDILYFDLEYDITNNTSSNYILFIKVLTENKSNFRSLIIAKFIRVLEQFNVSEIDLLSLRNEINFSNEFDIINTYQRLKSLNYINKQKIMNSYVVNYDDVKYVNKRFLNNKNKITFEHYESIYNMSEYNKYVASKRNEESVKEEIYKIKKDVANVKNRFNKDMIKVKEMVTQMQNNFVMNMKCLNDNLISLELEFEKMKSENSHNNNNNNDDNKK